MVYESDLAAHVRLVTKAEPIWTMQLGVATFCLLY